MKKTIFTLSLSVLVFALVISSCKKNDSSTGALITPPNTTAGSGNPSGTYNGLLIALSAPSSGTIISTGIAEFYNTPITFILGNSAPATATVNSVYMDTTRFSFNNPDYIDMTGTLHFPPAIWKVNGLGVIPSFTYTNYDALPVFTGTSPLPSSISKAQNLIIPLSGISGADQVAVEIDDSLSNSTTVYTSANSTSVTILKDSLAKLAPSYLNHGSITVTLVKYNPQTISGKSFLFGTAKQYSKSGVSIH